MPAGLKCRVLPMGDRGSPAEPNQALVDVVQLFSSNSREHRGLGLALFRRNVISLGSDARDEFKTLGGARFRLTSVTLSPDSVELIKRGACVSGYRVEGRRG